MMTAALHATPIPTEESPTLPGRDPSLRGEGADRTAWLFPAAPGIRGCAVNIPAWLKRYLPGLPADYRRAAAVRIPAAGVPGRFFSREELRRVNRFRTLKKQVEWMCGRWAVKRLVAEAGGEARPDRVRMAYEPGGAPRLVDHPRWTISISHAGDLAVAGLSRSSERFGLDVERLRPLDREAVFRVAFNDREAGYLRQRSLETFYRHWTLKEAYLKLRKTGFAENLRQVEVDGDRIRRAGRSVPGLALATRMIAPLHLLSVVRQAA